MKCVCIIILAALSSITSADNSTSLYYGVYTEHFSPSQEYNENNHLLLVTHRDWTAGAYNNSYDRQSVLLTYRVFSGRLHRGNWVATSGLHAGLVTGYSGEQPSMLGVSFISYISASVGRTFRHYDYGVQTLIVPDSVINAGFYLTRRF